MIKHMLQKICQMTKSRSVAISQKNLSCMIFYKKNERKHNERKFWELTVCNGNCQDAAYLQGTKETIQPFWADFFALGSSNSEGAQIDTKNFKIKNSRPLLIFIFNLKRNVRGIFVLPKPLTMPSQKFLF